ncbi:MAG: lipocalin-like domain-containing protein [Pseudomonadota bacterium]
MRVVLTSLGLGLCLLLAGCAPSSPGADADRGFALDRALGAQVGDGAFLKVTEAPDLQFPRDHGAHPNYRQEWWYFTGNLRTAQGRRFGYQATIFRFALGTGGDTAKGESASAWRTGQLYMAHLAVSDIEAGRFTAADRFARGALGLAGAESEPLKVWVEDWSIADDPSAGGAPFSVRLRFQDRAIGIDLSLVAERPVLRQGAGGYSRKGDDPSNASAYYSLTRLRSTGALRTAGERYEVAGTSWFDREWGTSFLAPGVAGWDWFSLQLDDGRDLMFYRLRGEHGESTRWSAGAIAALDGDGQWQVQRLDADEVQLEPVARWRSPASGVRYPVSWILRLPDQALVLEVKAALEDQELRLATRYWEGAVTVAGQQGERAVSGRGYLELAGY